MTMMFKSMVCAAAILAAGSWAPASAQDSEFIDDPFAQSRDAQGLWAGRQGRLIAGPALDYQGRWVRVAAGATGYREAPALQSCYDAAFEVVQAIDGRTYLIDPARHGPRVLEVEEGADGDVWNVAGARSSVQLISENLLHRRGLGAYASTDATYQRCDYDAPPLGALPGRDQIVEAIPPFEWRPPQGSRLNRAETRFGAVQPAQASIQPQTPQGGLNYTTPVTDEGNVALQAAVASGGN